MPLFDKTNLVVVLFLSLFLTLTVFGPIARASAPPSLEVSVFNAAHIPDENLRRAEARAGKIMLLAGVHVAWLNCPAAAPLPEAGDASRAKLPDLCVAIHYPEHVAVTILDHPRSATSDTFGQAYLNENGSGSYVDIYYGSISSLRSDLLLSPSEILGCVMAHEIGHLQLGLNSHSRTGLMCAHWDTAALSQAAKGQLLFSSSQSLAMRATLVQSWRLASASTTPTLVPCVPDSRPAAVSLNPLE